MGLMYELVARIGVLGLVYIDGPVYHFNLFFSPVILCWNKLLSIVRYELFFFNPHKMSGFCE